MNGDGNDRSHGLGHRVFFDKGDVLGPSAWASRRTAWTRRQLHGMRFKRCFRIIFSGLAPRMNMWPIGPKAPSSPRLERCCGRGKGAKGTLLWRRVFFVLFLSAGLAAASDLVVEGQIAYTAYTGSGKFFFRSTDQFTCRSSLSAAGGWNIRLQPAAGATNSFVWPAASYEVGGESNCVYRLRRSRPEVLTALAATNPSLARLPMVLGQARIIPLEVPPCEPGFHVGPIWLAFGSASCFQGRPSGIVAPVWPAPMEVLIDRDYSFRYTAEFSDPMREPLRVVFFSQGMYPDERPGKVTLTRYPKPFDESFTNAVFEVTAFTNLQARSFPSAFKLTQYRPKANGTTSADLVIAAEWVGSVHSMRVADALPDYKPVLADATNNFEDFRIRGRSARGFSYTTSNRVWAVSRREFGELESRSRLLDRAREQQPGGALFRLSTTQRRLVVLIVLGTLTCLASFLLLHQQHRKKP